MHTILNLDTGMKFKIDKPSFFLKKLKLENLKKILHLALLFPENQAIFAKFTCKIFKKSTFASLKT